MVMAMLFTALELRVLVAALEERMIEAEKRGIPQAAELSLLARLADACATLQYREREQDAVTY